MSKLGDESTKNTSVKDSKVVKVNLSKIGEKYATKKEDIVKVSKPIAVKQVDRPMVFGRRNYSWLIGGVLVLFLGYYLLSIEPFKDAQEFSIALYVAPWVIMLGYAIVIWAVMLRSNG